MTTRRRVLLGAMRAFVLLFGAAALWLGREAMSPDGVAYLDASDVYLGGGWPASRTGYWSPLYPTLLAVGRLIGGTGPEHELAIAQAVNLFIFLLAFLSLEYLIRSVRIATRARVPGAAPNDTAWGILAYALFAWATVGLARVWMLTPDLCVVAIVLAATGVAVRIASGRSGWGAIVALGVLLGLGYLAKAALFPVGVVMVLTLALALRRSGTMHRALVAGAVFLAVSAPQIAYVSRLSRRPTIGDVGRLNYLWYVAGVPGAVSSSFPLPARLPSPDSSGQTLAPLDPDRSGPPVVYDIDAPIPGTLPIWYDAGYWFRGVVAPIYPLPLARALVRHAREYLELFGFVLVGGIAAAAAGPLSRRTVIAGRPAPLLVVPALAALVVYGLVTVEPRYVAPFALPLFAGLVPPWATDDLSRRLRLGFAVGAVATLPFVVHQVRVDASYWRGSARARANVVAALVARGVGPGSRLGFIGEAYDAYWARQGQYRLVTLLPSAEAGRFWALDSAGRATIIDHMQARRVAAIVAEAPAVGVDVAGWRRLPPAGVPTPNLMVYGEVNAAAQR